MDRLSLARVASSVSPSPVPHCFRIQQLLRQRHVAARSLQYAALHAMRCPAADYTANWGQAPPAVGWISFFYLQRGMSHTVLATYLVPQAV